MRHVLATVFTLGLMLAASRAIAEPTAAEIAVARRLYGEAVRLEEAGDWAEAEQKLREAIAIKETPGLRFHLAVSQEKQGKLVEALVDYDRAHEMIERGSRAPDVEQLLGPARDAVRARIPSLTVKTPEQAEDPALSIDGNAVSRALLGKPIPLNPGRHTVRVEAAGFETFEAEVTLAESEKKSLDAALSPSSAPASPGAGAASTSDAIDPGADEPSGGGPSTRTIVLIGGVAFTVVALATGIGFTRYRADRNEQAEVADDAVREIREATGEDCKSDTTNGDLKKACSALDQFLDERDQAATFATIGFVAAGVGAVATVATYFLWKPEPEPSTARLGVGVAPLPGGAAIGLSGSF